MEEIFDSRRLSNGGPMTEALADRVRQTAGVPGCVLACNATSALQLAIRGFGLTGEVIVPSMTFAATAHAVSWLGLTPVFCDIDPATHNIDPAQAERLITPRTSAIIGVHLWGRPCDVEALETIAAEHDLRLLFDAAHAYGCSRDGQPTGRGGDAEIFSFHATKFVNAFEGGAVVTRDREAAARMAAMQNFGIISGDTVGYLGTNAKMSEISAAMALTSLDSIDDFVKHNQRNHECYAALLSGLPGVGFVRYDDREDNNFQYVVLTVDADEAGVSRDRLIEILAAENVHAKKYFSPGCHRMPPYAPAAPLPHTEWLADRVLALPTGTAVSQQDALRIGSIVRTALGAAPLP